MERPLDKGEVRQESKNLALGKRVEGNIRKRVSTSPYRDIKVTATSEGAISLSGVVQDSRARNRPTRPLWRFSGSAGSITN